jgi:hypothetical protein
MGSLESWPNLHEGGDCLHYYVMYHDDGVNYHVSESAALMSSNHGGLSERQHRRGRILIFEEIDMFESVHGIQQAFELAVSVTCCEPPFIISDSEHTRLISNHTFVLR